MIVAIDFGITNTDVALSNKSQYKFFSIPSKNAIESSIDEESQNNFSKKSLFRAQMLHFSLYFCVESTVVGTLTVLWDALHQRGLTRLLPGSNMFLLMTSAYSKKIFEVREGFNFLTAYLACHKP